MAIINGVAKSADEGFYPKEIEQSLRFNDDDSAYLSWVPASEGNRKTWTWSGWVKRGNIGSRQTVFQVNSDTTGTTSVSLEFFDNDRLYLWIDHSGYWSVPTTSQVFRDPSAWYHIVLVMDTTQSTASNRTKFYINGELAPITFEYSTTYISQNADLYVNATRQHNIGVRQRATSTYDLYLDSYLSEVHFTDGTAYDATAFGEFKNGVWVAKTPDVTYGTNGFYLPFKNDYTVEGFSAVTYTGNGSTQYIGGVGFEPDLVWIKSRSFSNNHHLFDSVRGASKILRSSTTDAESTLGVMTSFDSDGFTVAETGGNNATNDSGSTFVAWCWDAGTGSPASNTDGSITSTVKANPDYGFSVVGYTGTGANATVGHGLSSAPDMLIVKNRDTARSWIVYHASNTANPETEYLELNTTAATSDFNTLWNDTAPTSSVFSLGTATSTNQSGDDHIAYCFHSVSGYSDFGSYTGTGASGNTVTTGFRPAFVMIKRTDSTGSWIMFDAVRDPTSPINGHLLANGSDAEYTDLPLTISDTGFSFTTTGGDHNGSGNTYIYMAFADTREAAFWLDDSGNNNDWENNGLTESDISLDSPTNNFATLNPLDKDASCTLSEGNLKYSAVATGYRNVRSSTFVGTGKWYAEFCPTTLTYESRVGFGIAQSDAYLTQVIGNTATSYNVYWQYTNTAITKRNNSTDTNLTSAGNLQVNDVIQIAVDFDAGKIWWGWNGTWLDSGDPSSGINPIFSGIASGDYAFMLSGYTDGAGIVNFGQDSSFAGNKTPQGYTDANGRGDFYYAPPAGYLALCTANLPEPAIGPNSATLSDEHFNTLAYSGTEGTDSKTGIGFQPDFTWIKARSGAYGHALYDAVRGATNQLSTNSTGAEATNPANGILTSFDSDGFSVSAGSSSDLNVNDGSATYVAWNWKANGSGVSNTDGSITSTVSANTDAGFSIVSYTGTGANATVGHGLDDAPDMVIVKRRDATADWPVYSQALCDVSGQDYTLALNTTGAQDLSSNRFQGTAPTISVFSIGTSAYTNATSSPYIAYCFHSVEGFSKFGSYTGNGSTDGTFVHTGFRPAFIMVKKTDGASQWGMYDSKRNTFNVMDNLLRANLSNAEQDNNSDLYLDFTSNGFKWRTGYSDWNGSGNTYIFMAFAECPTKYSVGR